MFDYLFLSQIRHLFEHAVARYEAGRRKRQ
jgi:hypothetical protein